VRRTPLEYHVLDGKIYVYNAWPQADWFHNVQAEPRVTVQTHQRPMSALARVLQSNEEYMLAFRLVERSPLLRMLMESAGIEPSLSTFLAEKERFQIVAFDPTDLQTPPGLRSDLKWFMPAALVLFGLGFFFGNQIKTQRNKPRGFWEKLTGKK
jgi:deazaflavin-dependent oxidoreductase (nitroreductase family)